MKIKSTEDLKKLFDILDDGDTVIVSNEDWNQIQAEWWGGVSNVSPTKTYIFGTRWLLNFGDKTILIKLKEKEHYKIQGIDAYDADYSKEDEKKITRKYNEKA